MKNKKAIEKCGVISQDTRNVCEREAGHYGQHAARDKTQPLGVEVFGEYMPLDTKRRPLLQIARACHWTTQPVGDRWTWRLIAANGSTVLAKGNLYPGERAAREGFNSTVRAIVSIQRADIREEVLYV